MKKPSQTKGSGGRRPSKTYSPKARHAMKREAEKQTTKAPKSTCFAKTMKELLDA